MLSYTIGVLGEWVSVPTRNEVLIVSPPCVAVQQSCMLCRCYGTAQKNSPDLLGAGPVGDPTLPELHPRYSYTRAAMISQHRQGSLNNRYLFSHNAGSWKSKIKVLASLVSSKVSFLGLHMTFFPMCLHIISPPLTSVLISSYKDTSHTGSGSTHMTSFYLSYVF